MICQTKDGFDKTKLNEQWNRTTASQLKELRMHFEWWSCLTPGLVFSLLSHFLLLLTMFMIETAKYTLFLYSLMIQQFFLYFFSFSIFIKNILLLENVVKWLFCYTFISFTIATNCSLTKHLSSPFILLNPSQLSCFWKLLSIFLLFSLHLGFSFYCEGKLSI